MENKVYYRVFTTKEHLNDWNNKKYNSYHHAVPSLWSDLYYKQGLRDTDSFPLRFLDGSSEVEYTSMARTHFLELAPKYRAAEVWKELDWKAVSELNGICAFDSATDAYNYGCISPVGRISRELYVVFYGNVVCRAPENNGYVVQITEVIAGPMTSKDFRVQFIY